MNDEASSRALTARIVVLRVLGIACLIANLAIGMWFASTEASMGAKVLAMAVLAALVVLGFALLASAARLRARRLGPLPARGARPE